MDQTQEDFWKLAPTECSYILDEEEEYGSDKENQQAHLPCGKISGYALRDLTNRLSELSVAQRPARAISLQQKAVQKDNKFKNSFNIGVQLIESQHARGQHYQFKLQEGCDCTIIFGRGEQENQQNRNGTMHEIITPRHDQSVSRKHC